MTDKPRKKPGPKGDRAIRLDVRITKAGNEAILAAATEAGVERSEMTRRLLSAALADPKIRRSVTKPQ